MKICYKSKHLNSLKGQDKILDKNKSLCCSCSFLNSAHDEGSFDARFSFNCFFHCNEMFSNFSLNIELDLIQLCIQDIYSFNEHCK